MRNHLRYLVIFTCILAAQVLPAQSIASIIYGGSEYKLVVDWGITWMDAKTAAEATGWQLATLTSAEENSYIYNNLVLPQGPVGDITWISYWIGGVQNPITEIVKSNGWEWVTGEAWNYTNWNGGEPNDFYGSASEYYLEFLYSNGKWNDLGSPQWVNGYIEERVVPEPSTFVLLSAGLAGLAALGIRRRKVNASHRRYN